MRETEFGRALKLARNKANMTQDELAGKINYTKQAISNWERGISTPDPETCNDLQVLLDFEPEAPKGRKGKLNTLIPLQNIKIITELESSIQGIISALRFQSPFETTVNYMLKKVLWITTGDAVFHNITFHRFEEIMSPKKEPFYIGWEHISEDIDCCFWASIESDENSIIANKLAYSIYEVLSNRRELFYGNPDGIGKEGSFIRKLAEDNDPEFKIALDILHKSMRESEDFKNMFPQGKEENAVITELRRGLMELRDFLKQAE